MSFNVIGLPLVFATLAFSTSLESAVILSPDGIVSNSMGGTASQGNLISQAGLSAGFTSGLTDFDTYLAGDPTHSSLSGQWVSDLALTTGTIVLDLGDSYQVERIAIWQGGDSSTRFRNIQNITVATSNDSAFAVATDVGSFVVPQGDSASYGANEFDVADSLARYVRLTVDSNYGNNRTQFGEVAFAVTPIPEPSSALALGTAVLIGLIRRRRY